MYGLSEKTMSIVREVAELAAMTVTAIIIVVLAVKLSQVKYTMDVPALTTPMTITITESTPDDRGCQIKGWATVGSERRPFEVFVTPHFGDYLITNLKYGECQSSSR